MVGPAAVPFAIQATSAAVPIRQVRPSFVVSIRAEAYSERPWP